jgi:hypothetical protein
MLALLVTLSLPVRNEKMKTFPVSLGNKTGPQLGKSSARADCDFSDAAVEAGLHQCKEAEEE